MAQIAIQILGASRHESKLPNIRDKAFARIIRIGANEMKIVAALLLALALAGCVDGVSGKFFICGVTTSCK